MCVVPPRLLEQFSIQGDPGHACELLHLMKRWLFRSGENEPFPLTQFLWARVMGGVDASPAERRG